MEPLDEFAREEAILLELEAAGRVSVNDLAARFGVSTVTIRKDLDGLERRALLHRIRGGAVSAAGSDEGAWSMRARHSSDAKRAIARAVAPMVRSREVIALDSSTTCYAPARELLDRRGLVVVTNGLRTATLLMEESDAMVIVPGGVLRRSAESVVGPIGDVLSGRGEINKGFFGTVGLSTELGLLEVSVDEAHTKAFVAGACRQVYGLFDSSKATRFGLHPFAAPDRITGLYTDEGVSEEFVADWRAVGIDVHVVSVPAAPVSQLRDGSA
jgi:DeoR family transcriptional regulator of aga operon